MAVERAESESACPSRPLGSEVTDKHNTKLVPPKEPDVIKQEAEKPYSIYTLSEKWYIVSMASLAALFRYGHRIALVLRSGVPHSNGAFLQSVDSQYISPSNPHYSHCL